MIKLIGLIKKVTDTGLLKPLPLSGLGKEIVKLKESKNKGQAYLRIGAYVLGGLTIYGLIAKGLAPDVAMQVLEILF